MFRPSHMRLQPEMQAQTTLINFTVTRDGLEEQLLAAVVAKERPDLEKLKASLTHQQNQFKITLKSLEDSLLARLSTAEGNFLGDYDLVENLETTKRTAMEIEEKVEEAKLTETQINEAREAYRPVAMRASLLYFVLNDLNKIHPMYQFSLKVRQQLSIGAGRPAGSVYKMLRLIGNCGSEGLSSQQQGLGTESHPNADAILDLWIYHLSQNVR